MNGRLVTSSEMRVAQQAVAVFAATLGLTVAQLPEKTRVWLLQAALGGK